MSPRGTGDYLDLITPYHRGRPKYRQTVSTVVEPVAQAQAVLSDLSLTFDLDSAIGVQLDHVGEWVGRSRYVNIPLASVWFSFDTEGLGWNQGIWKGEFDPDTGLYALDDETYRSLLKLKIIANQWDGTIEFIRGPMERFFSSDGVYIYIEDRFDMTMIFGVSGLRPNAAFLALLTGGYIPIKPEGVRASYLITSVVEAPIFGFDVNNDYLGGWDRGSWGVPPDFYNP